MKKYRIQPPAGRASRVDYAAALNAEQKAVVTRGTGPALVIAGAGSGKTRVITYRVAWLIEQGVAPDSILLMTFTNKAAREMLGRVDALTGAGAAKKVMGGTFHHVANLLLRRHAGSLGFSSDFTILDPEDRADLLQSVLGECATAWREQGRFGEGKDPLTERRFPSAAVIGNLISDAINRQANLSKLLAAKFPYFADLADLVGEVAKGFAARKRERDLMDFDDLLLWWKILLERDEPVREAMRARFQHVLVDEYQDTNKLQADVIDALGAPDRNVTVVGDDAQSIYAFRGAHFANIMEFPKRYPSCVTFRLETNYRSTPQILALANGVIEENRHQFKKVLKASRPAGELPALVPARDVQQQSEFVAQRILELRDEGIPLDEIAVLYRNHSHSLEMQVELSKRGIPFDVRSGMRFFERAHVKDVLCHLRIVANPRDEVAWVRVARLYPRIGSTTAERIWRYLSGVSLDGGSGGGSAPRREAHREPERATTGRNGDRPAGAGTRDAKAIVERLANDAAAEAAVPPAARDSWKRLRETRRKLAPIATRPAELIETVIGGDYGDVLRSRYPDADSRIDDLKQLAVFAATYDSTQAFLSEVALLAEVSPDSENDSDEDEGQVTLSTVHRAKGLEWRAVFVLWVADGHFPWAMALDESRGGSEGEEEERRLFYVAITRAKDQLYLTHPIVDMRRDGRAVLLKPSRFLEELKRPEPYEKWELEVGLPTELPPPGTVPGRLAGEAKADDDEGTNEWDP